MNKKERNAMYKEILKGKKAALAGQLLDFYEEIQKLKEKLVEANTNHSLDLQSAIDANIDLKHEQNLFNKKIKALEHKLDHKTNEVNFYLENYKLAEETAASKFSLTEIVGFVLLAVLITVAV